MTPRERMRVALGRGKPHHVPIAMVADSDFIAKAAGRPLWELEHGDLETKAAIARDAHLRFPDNSFMLAGANTDRETMASRRIVYEDGKPLLEMTETGERHPLHDRPTAAEWWDETRKGPEHSTSRSGWAHPVESEADIQRVLGEPQTVEWLLQHGCYDVLKRTREHLGDAVYIGVAGHGVFPGAIDIMGGFDRGMLALAERPHVFRALIEELAHRRNANVACGAATGADAAWLGGYLEGADLISPKVWREVVLPGHRIQVEFARKLGVQVLFWFLGDAMPLLGDIADLGIDGLVIEQPRRGYSSDPLQVKREVGDAFCVYGWNWELDFIRDNREGITREVERQIRDAGTEGAFIMGTTYLTAEASLDAIDHFCREVIRVSGEVGYEPE
jgi:hypothetical protein